MIYETLGDRLKLALEMRGIKQNEFAKRIGVSEVSVSRYISDCRQPRADMIVKICRDLGVSSDWLLGMKRGESEGEE